ncbi:polysaccharide biosynthesis protein [Alicyclobacillaceae bacterium I2511]|nr:polysaccharide biosynthesis protein [Alicyclobacillaceae bacterium I2511]
MVAMVTLAKLLGLAYIFPLTRLIHDEGMGIYANAYSLYVILLQISTSGFPTAMGKLISERLAIRRYADVEQMYRLTLRLVTVLGIVLFVVMWVGAPWYSRLVALRESRDAVAAITLSIRALSFSLLIVPALSGLRGYLQGFQAMEASAYSQAVEQLVRVIAIVLGAYLVMRHGGSMADGAAAATFGAFVGGVAGLILLAVAVLPLRRDFKLHVSKGQPSLSSGQVLRVMFAVALPVSLGALVVPIANLIDSLTVTNLLTWVGFSFGEATADYGVLSRQAMQLIQLPLAFAMAIGASLLPAISQAKAIRNERAIQSHITGTLRSMLLMTVPVAATLLVLGRPLDQVLFGSQEGAVIISSVSFMSIFSSLELLTTYMLQGLGQLYRPVRNMFIGVLIHLIFNLALIPFLHIIGAAIATTLGYIISSTLNVLAVRKYGKVHFSVWKISLPFLVASVPLLLVQWAGSFVGYHLLHPLFPSPDAVGAVQILLAVALGGLVYLTAALRLRAVAAEELIQIPWLGNRLARFANRVSPPRATPRFR